MGTCVDGRLSCKASGLSAMNAYDITVATGGKWFGGYGLTFCPAHSNDRTPALSLKDGEGERLLAHCHAGCDFRAVFRALRERGLLDARATPEMAIGGVSFTGPDRSSEDQRRGIMRAQTVWNESTPIEGTLAELYLRRRSILGCLPDGLRYHPACWHPTAQRLPALVAGISEISRSDIVAVHRTYLQASGDKATITPAKAMLGPAAGCGVQVSRGAGPLVIAEGIETALSLAEGLTDHAPHTVAALSTSGVSGLRLPDLPHDLIIAPDGDAAGEKAAETLANRASKLGWRVRILPAPGRGLDWNDVAVRSTA